MLDNQLRMQFIAIVAKAIAIGRALATDSAALETGDPDRDAILRRVVEPLKSRNAFCDLDEGDLVELSLHLDQELARETDGVELCAGYTVTVGDETIHYDLYTVPRYTARGEKIRMAQRSLKAFIDARDHVADLAAAQRELAPQDRP